MKATLVALLLACLSCSAEARPSPYPSVTPFAGDRYAGRSAQMGYDVARAVRSQRRAKARHYRHHYRKPAPGYVSRQRTTGRPRAWCGWWLGQHLGMPLRHLWIARNWAKVGSPAGGPRIGAIVVWHHHVGIITGRRGDLWVVKSGNDGHAVRERPRSVAGAIAFRSL